jgi:hypothetical protein
MALKAGFPDHIFAITLDAACTSSLVAARLGYRSIKLGECEAVLAMGAESMSRTGLYISHEVRWGTRIGNIVASDWYFGLVYPGFKAASADTGDVALEYSEGKLAAKYLAEAGFDALEISQGLRGPSDGDTEFRTKINSLDREAYFRDCCRQIKNQVDIPVMMVGGLRTFKLMEEVI